jgi:hypothetical protein
MAASSLSAPRGALPDHTRELPHLLLEFSHLVTPELAFVLEESRPDAESIGTAQRVP